jgi:tetratricopeptide (TPR) repeat protein
MNEDQVRQAVALAELASHELKGLDARVWLDRIEGQHQDLEAAFGWLLHHEHNDNAMRMAVRLYDFWSLNGRIAEGRSWIDRAFAAGLRESALRAEACYRAGLLAFWQGDDEAASALHRDSLDLARQRGDRTAIALALGGLARIELRSGNLEGARSLCTEALETVEGTDDKEGRSNALHVLAVTAQMQGNLVEARARMTERLELARETGNFGSVAMEASNLSHVERRLGNLERAEQLAMESLQISQRRGDDWIIPYVLSALAASAVENRRFTRASQLLGAAAQMVDQQGAAWPPDEAPLFEQTRRATAQALGIAVFEANWSAGCAMSVSDAVSYALAAHPI